MVRIGVIDSLVYSDELACNLKICNPRGLQNKNGHGIDVVRYILFECLDVEIINYVIIGEYDKGKVEELIDGIEFCILEQVDVINISVGVKNVSHANFLKLQDCCEKAYRQGITLIAAGSNDGEVSYPAYLENVVIVSEKDLLLKDKAKNKWAVYYDSSMVFSKAVGKSIFNNGNSFLCAITTGAYAAFLSEGILKRDQYGFADSFLDICHFLYSNELLSKMHTNKEMIEDCVYIRFCEQDEMDTEVIKKFRPKIVCHISDVKDVGLSFVILGNVYYPIDKKIKEKIIGLLFESGINKIYSIKPIFNIYERYVFYMRYNILVKNIYM